MAQVCVAAGAVLLTAFGSAARGGPVIRELALVGAVILFESAPGTWAEASIAAMLERMDTEWMRRDSLAAMSG